MRLSSFFARVIAPATIPCTNRSFLPSILLWSLFLTATIVNAQQPFISTWKTDNSGTSGTTSIIIPTTGSGYNYEVDWNNDGTYEQTGITGDVTHDFGAAGTYTIRIRGAFPRIYFNGAGDRRKLTGISQWGSIAWTSMAAAFKGCENLQITSTDLPDLTGVTDMSEMFRGCFIVNGPTNIGSWNVSNVTTMQRMFNEAYDFNQAIGTWNTANVTDMSFMFFNTGDFNKPIGSWNTAAVTNMQGMFYANFVFNQAIGNWNTGNVTDMSLMFNNAITFNQPVGNWNTANVTTMRNMFFGAHQFNQVLGNWNTANVTDMSSMFQGALAFNQDLGLWNTANVTTMRNMFLNAGVFNRYLGAWTLNANVDMTNMLNSTNTNCSNYSATLQAWSNNPSTPSGRTLGASGRQYGTNVVAARNNLTANKGWTINGDTPSGSMCAFVLPVTWIDFTAKPQDKGVLLEWQTAEEQNNLGYYIERSTDGVRWEDLGFVPGQGTTTEEQLYAFLDEMPLPATNYYRLRQTDYDGAITFTKIVQVELRRVGTVQIFPNPVLHGEVNLVLSENSEESVAVRLMSPSGVVVRAFILIAGNNTLNVKDLPAGMYLLKVGQNFEKIILEN